MAEFAPAVANTELFEGGYSFNPQDPGGETYRGISRKSWPQWAGWAIIDLAKTELNGGAQVNPQCRQVFFSSLDTNQELQGLVVTFYHDNFWQYDQVHDQTIANKLFDLSVNMGTEHAIKIAQGAVNLPQDGVFGPRTLASINATYNGSLIQLIRLAAENYHKQIVASHPEEAEFLNGWLRRDES